MPAGPLLALDRSARWKSEDGHLHVAISNISIADVNPYYGREIPDCQGLGLDPDQKYMLLRDPAELEKAAETFNGLRIMSKHVAVSASDTKEEFVVGATGTDAAFDGTYLTNSLVIWRQQDIDKIESQDKCELSCGYYYTAVMRSGEYKGKKYDGRMTNIRGNHVALVEAGRAGPSVMVHDSKESKMQPLASRKALLVKGALAGYLLPKLTPGASLAMDAALADVTRANWTSQKPNVIDAITKLATPKLATDANLDDLHKFIDRLDNQEDGEAEDDEIDGMDEDDDDKDDKKDEKKADDKKARDMKAKDKKAKDAKACDEDDEDEDKEEEKKEARDRRAKDKKAKDAKAMDAAIDSLRADMRAAAEAREIVRPYVGQVSLALDSAPEIYGVALKHFKIATDGVPPEAFKAMVQMLPKPGSQRPAIAMDAANDGGLDAMFPQLSRIGQG